MKLKKKLIFLRKCECSLYTNIEGGTWAVHSKKYCVVLTLFWVKYGQTQSLSSFKKATQTGLSVFDPKLGWNNPAFFRVYWPEYQIWTEKVYSDRICNA